MFPGIFLAWPLVIVLIGPMLATTEPEHDWGRWVECNEMGDQVKYCAEREAEWQPTSSTIRVDSGNFGGVSVIGWDENRVRVKATLHVIAKDAHAAAEIADQVKLHLSDELIVATGPENGDGVHWSVTFRVWGPRKSNLDLLANNGPIAVTGVSGKMRLSTENGPLSLSGVSGKVLGRTRNGPLTVRLEGDHWEGDGLDAETRNGPVSLSIPEHYSAQLETGTLNGPMRVDLPVRTRRGEWISTELGEGGAPVRVVTSNGPASIRRD